VFAIGLPSNIVAYKRIAGTNPGAGVECSDIVPTDKFWIVLAYTVQLVQGVTQTPLPILVFDDGTNTIFESPGTTTAQGASTTAQYTWGPDMLISGQIGATPNIRSVGCLSPILLKAGFHVKTVTLGIGAGSDYGAPSIYVAELG
jgi:hypothetical protein